MADKRLPNLFILGAAKAGTTTLYDTLKKYHQAYFPVQKEPAFFCDDDYYQNGIEWYLSTFYSKAGNFQVRGDATPRYLFWGEKVIPRLKLLYDQDQPKMIVIFRDPAKLIYSYYWQNVREGRETLGFSEALAAEKDRDQKIAEQIYYHGKFTYSYSRLAAYASQLKTYLDNFPKQNFLFLLTDDFTDFQKLTRTLEQFLNLDHMEWKKPVTSNLARLPRNRAIHKWLVQRSKFKDLLKPIIGYSLRHKIKQAAINMNLKPLDPPVPDPAIMLMLRKHYQHEVQQLEEMIERDLSSWYPK